jgi:hypothetical protein
LAHSKNSHNKLRNWERLNRRRSLARCKAKAQVLDEYDLELVALDAELAAEFEEQLVDDERDNWLDWPALYPIWDYGMDSWPDDDWDRDDGWGEAAVRRDLDFDIFEAVDRAVRCHGLEATRKQAHLLASAFNVSVWEIEDCIKHTRAGYING